MSDTTLRTPAVAAAPVARRVSWGAIIAGTLLTFTVQLMLGLLGIGVGLSTVDPAGNGTPDLSTFGTASGIWAGASVLIATFVGGYAAARLAASATRTDGALHGIVTWALSTLLVVYLLTSGAASLATRTLGVIGTSLSSVTSGIQAIVPNSLAGLPEGLQTQARALLQRADAATNQAATDAQNQAQGAANDARAATGEEDLSAAIAEIVRGVRTDATPEERQAAVTLISQRAGITPAEAQQRLQQFQSQATQALEQARQAADTAARNASTAAFVAFVALLIGAIVAALGGLAGRPRVRAVATYV